VVGGLGCVGVKLNVVQKRWLCALVCTSFNFTKRWLSFVILWVCSMFAGCLIGLQITIGLGEVRAIVFVQPERQMIKVTKDEDNYKSRTENFQPGLWLNRITVAHY